MCILSLGGLCLPLAGCTATVDRAATASIVGSPVETSGLPQHFSFVVRMADASGPLSNAEAEAVIARAIAEHEMRRP